MLRYNKGTIYASIWLLTVTFGLSMLAWGYDASCFVGAMGEDMCQLSAPYRSPISNLFLGTPVYALLCMVARHMALEDGQVPEWLITVWIVCGSLSLAAIMNALIQFDPNIPQVIHIIVVGIALDGMFHGLWKHLTTDYQLEHIR